MKLILILVLTSVSVQLALSYVQPLPRPTFQRIPEKLIDYKLILEGRSGFFDQIHNLVDGIIADATGFLKDYAKKPTEIVADIEHQVQAIAGESQGIVANLKKEVTDLLDSWKTTNANALNCTKKYAPLMKNVTVTFNASISDCIQNATASAKEIENTIAPHILLVAKYRMELETLISDCFQKTSNIFLGISCAFVNAYDFKLKIVETIAEIKTIIVTSTTESVKIVSNARKCISSAVNVYVKDMRDLQQQYKDCIVNGVE